MPWNPIFGKHFHSEGGAQPLPIRPLWQDLDVSHALDMHHIPMTNTFEHLTVSEPRHRERPLEGLTLQNYKFAKRKPRLSPVQLTYGLGDEKKRGSRSAGMRLPSVEEARGKFPRELFCVKRYK